MELSLPGSRHLFQGTRLAQEQDATKNEFVDDQKVRRFGDPSG
jgi:hypothetical protein